MATKQKATKPDGYDYDTILSEVAAEEADEGERSRVLALARRGQNDSASAAGPDSAADRGLEPGELPLDVPVRSSGMDPAGSQAAAIGFGEGDSRAFNPVGEPPRGVDIGSMAGDALAVDELEGANECTRLDAVSLPTARSRFLQAWSDAVYHDRGTGTAAFLPTGSTAEDRLTDEERAEGRGLLEATLREYRLQDAQDKWLLANDETAPGWSDRDGWARETGRRFGACREALIVWTAASPLAALTLIGDCAPLAAGAFLPGCQAVPLEEAA